MSRGMIFGAVGAVIGFVAGGFTPTGAYYGYVAGSAIGALTAPTQRIEGPRIETTPITGAAEGDPIPYVIVNGRVGGGIAWCSPKRPVPHTTEQGKGGGVESTTYTSEWDMLIILDGHRTAGVRRSWRLGKLVYSAATGADAQTLADSATTDAWRRMTVYTGGPDQMPDPVYEAFHGVGNVSAHRNVTSVFIEGYQSDFGGQYIPLSFEVVEEGEFAEGVDVQWNAADKDPVVTLSGGGFTATNATATYGAVRANIGKTDGNWYWEFTVDVLDVSTDCWLGASGAIDGLSNVIGSYNPRAMLRSTGEISSLSLNTTLSGFSYGVGDVVGVAIKAATGDAWFHINGVYYGLGNPSTGAAPTCNAGTPDPGDSIKAWFGADNSPGTTTVTANFGPDFAYPIPAGFAALTGTPDTLSVNLRSLADVITQLTEQTGLLTANDIDVTDVEDIMVRGMVLNQATNTRAAIEKLLDAYLVEPYEDDRIVYRKRGGDPVVTIPYRDLGASEGGEFPEPLPIGLRNDIEVPARIRGKFGNVFNDFQVGLTPEGDRLTTDSLETRIVDLGLQLTPLEAARVIDVKTAELTVERRSLGPIVVTRKYAALKPTNVILVENHDGSTYRARISKITDSGLLRTLELRPDDASTINPSSEVDNTDYSQTIVRNNVVTEIEALDAPAFRDADLGPGHYERIGAVGRWDGARFQVSQNDADWSDVDLVNQRATYGVATTVLADFGGGNVFDDRSWLDVSTRYGEFSSATADELIASRTRNLIVVGAQGREEALQYRTATPLDAATVRLSCFLRGRFGTEHAMASHQVGDHVVLMQPAGIVRVDSDISAIGATRYYRAISFGKLVSSANSETFVNGGVCLRPYSAANPRVVRDAAGNATLSCHYRPRRAGRLFGPMGSSFPLDEAVEAWLWEIYSDDTYTTVVRTLPITAITEAAYSAAEQTTDFGSPQAVIHARVYRLSESVGRGYPLEIAA